MIRYSNAERRSSVSKLHNILTFQFIPFTSMTWFFPRVYYYGSTQGHGVYDLIFLCYELSYVNKLHNVASSCSCRSCSWLDFPHWSNIMKVHEVTLFTTWYSYAKSWVQSTSYTMSHLPVRVIHIHDLIFPSDWISWKYTKSLCLWPDIPMLKAEFRQQAT